MYGQLQFSTDGGTTYKYLGTLRPFKGRVYKIDPVEELDRNEEPETVAYKVMVESICSSLDSELLDNDTHYFRIIFPYDLKMITLGQRRFIYSYDSLLTRHSIDYHTVKLEFIIALTDIESFNAAVNLPISEGGVYLEDSGLYIED